MYKNGKYETVINLIRQHGGKDLKVEEGEGKLKIWATVGTQYEKDQIWDEIKRIGGEKPDDLMADIKAESGDQYHKHTVEAGETLSKISKKYYGDVNQYMKIYNANRGILNNPDLIHPGQQLVIPKA